MGHEIDMLSRHLSNNNLAGMEMETLHGAHSTTNGDGRLESLDVQSGFDWEGYLSKKGHLVRNWKFRYFTLEQNLLSYYETKEDARKRRHLKGRNHLTKVSIIKGKSAHGYDFEYDTAEDKTFHVSAVTELEQIAWVKVMQVRITFRKFMQFLYHRGSRP